MKKLVSILLAVFLSIPALAFSKSYSPEEVKERLQVLVPWDDVLDFEYAYTYKEETKQFALVLDSQTVENVATESIEEKKETENWRIIKESIYGIYEVVREMLNDAYGCSNNGLYIILTTEFGEKGAVYYAIGDKDGGECVIFTDVVTKDEKPTKPKEGKQ